MPRCRQGENPCPQPQVLQRCFNLPEGSPPKPLSCGVCFLSRINIFLSPAGKTGNPACVPICKPKVGHPKGSRESLILGAGKSSLATHIWTRKKSFKKKIYQSSFLDLWNECIPFCRTLIFGHWDQRTYFDYACVCSMPLSQLWLLVTPWMSYGHDV